MAGRPKGPPGSLTRPVLGPRDGFVEIGLLQAMRPSTSPEGRPCGGRRDEPDGHDHAGRGRLCALQVPWRERGAWIGQCVHGGDAPRLRDGAPDEGFDQLQDRRERAVRRSWSSSFQHARGAGLSPATSGADGFARNSSGVAWPMMATRAFGTVARSACCPAAPSAGSARARCRYGNAASPSPTLRRS